MTRPVPTANPGTAATPAAAPASAAPANSGDETTLELAGGAIAILALAGAAFAIARRRRRAVEEEWSQEPVDEYLETAPEAQWEQEETSTPELRDEAIAGDQPAIVAPPASAFAWGNEPREDQQSQALADDRQPGETWVERAYRGPTANNPSLSLRRRLKRAAFFDKQERENAGGSSMREEAAADEEDLVPA